MEQGASPGASQPAFQSLQPQGQAVTATGPLLLLSTFWHFSHCWDQMPGKTELTEKVCLAHGSRVRSILSV